MKKLFLLLSLTLFIMGCKDDFNIDNLPEASAKMVVYCMPSASDTTYITVSRSIPLKQLNDRKPNPMIDNAHIDYHLNGQALPVTALGSWRIRKRVIK